MSARRRYSAALAGATFAGAALLAACYTSPAPQTFPHATSPYGASVTLWLVDGRKVRGELLALEDTTAMLLARETGRIAVARPPVIRSIEFSVVDVVRFAGSGLPRRRELEQARLRARFPYGMSPAVREALLAKAGQAAPDTLVAVKR